MANEESSTNKAPNPRRTLLWRVAAGLAGAAGVGVSLRHTNDADVVDPAPGFWEQQWETPNDAVLPMTSFKGRPLLVNFWATWCPPCVEELPLLQRFYTEQGARGVQVFGLALDRKAAVLPFLAKMPLSFPVALGGLSGADLGRALGNLTGGLPFSVLIASDGAVAQRKVGRVSAEDLRLWAAVK